MANVVTASSLNSDSRLLKIVSDGSDETILTWNQVTDVLSSNYLTTEQLRILQARFTALVSNLALADRATLTHILQSMLVLSEWKGVGTPVGAADGTTSTLKVTGFLNGVTYYLVVSIPHSIGPTFGPAPL